MHKAVVLKFSCDDQPGIVATVATFFAELGFNIEESSQYEDPETQQFFMRTVFQYSDKTELSLKSLKEKFLNIAARYSMAWELHDKSQKMKVLIAVSKWGHCLNNLLNSWKNGALPVDIVGVVSNHEDMRSMVEWYGLPYTSVAELSKNIQEQKILELMELNGCELLVLARYMQILSDDLCDKLKGRAINIHHSFLPGFKGARPYHQAHQRGVKLIGATAHYVTADLDEGPIIEQAVERVSHADSAEAMVSIGRDTEAVVLTRAVRWHAEYRVLLNSGRTVIFRR